MPTGDGPDVPRTDGRVEAVGLEPGAGHGDVEPELVEDGGRAARSQVAAERSVDVAVDWLQREPVRVTYTRVHRRLSLDPTPLFKLLGFQASKPPLLSH